MSAPALPRVLIAGNICVDLFPGFTSGQLASGRFLLPGASRRIGPATVSIGGCVANSGIALDRLGIPATFVFAVADDRFGAIVEDHLRRHTGPRARLAARRFTGAGTSYTLILSAPDHDRTLLYYPGVNDLCDADFVAGAELAGHDLLHFGYPAAMRRMCQDHAEPLRGVLQAARDRGMLTTLDACTLDDRETRRVDWIELYRRVLPLVDVFMPSLGDLVVVLEDLAGDAMAIRDFDRSSPHARGELVRALGSRLLDLGAAVAVIKLGSHGLYLRAGDSMRASSGRLRLDAAAWAGFERYRPCFRAKVVGTTGAGDSTVSGFIAALCRGLGPEPAMTAALAAGACSTEGVDATGAVPSWPSIERRLIAGWPSHPPTVAV